MRYRVLPLLLAIGSMGSAQDVLKTGPMIFIRGKAPVTQTGGGAGIAVQGVAVGGGSASYGGDDETMIIASDLLKKCPDVSLTVSEEAKPDYILLFNRSVATFLSGSMNQFMLLRRDKSVIYANEKGTSMKAAKDACKVIMADWKRNSAATSANTQASPADSWWKAGATPAQTEPQK